jgi:hypothetical protein
MANTRWFDSKPEARKVAKRRNHCFWKCKGKVLGDLRYTQYYVAEAIPVSLQEEVDKGRLTMTLCS